MAAHQEKGIEQAVATLAQLTAEGLVSAAALYVRHEQQELVESFGAATSPDDIFLLASISKPISVAALMTLYDQGKFNLHDPVRRFIPEFAGEGRESITVRQLLTHVSGLPDQLPENRSLRERQADLSEFVQATIRTPLLFAPGAQFGYSSMGILLAAEIAQRITATPFPKFVNETVLGSLGMRHSALGLADFKIEDTLRCQVEHAAPESGAGDPTAKDWDWNSSYWRNLGAPWGGAHGSVTDIARFMTEFLAVGDKLLRPETAQLMITNQNRGGIRPRGLGFAIGPRAGSPRCSQQTFGHEGVTGTLAWADPATETICVVLTTLPAPAANPHPRQIVSDCVADAVV